MKWLKTDVKAVLFVVLLLGEWSCLAASRPGRHGLRHAKISEKNAGSGHHQSQQQDDGKIHQMRVLKGALKWMGRSTFSRGNPVGQLAEPHGVTRHEVHGKHFLARDAHQLDDPKWRTSGRANSTVLLGARDMVRKHARSHAVTWKFCSDATLTAEQKCPLAQGSGLLCTKQEDSPDSCFQVDASPTNPKTKVGPFQIVTTDTDKVTFVMIGPQDATTKKYRIAWGCKADDLMNSCTVEFVSAKRLFSFPVKRGSFSLFFGSESYPNLEKISQSKGLVASTAQEATFEEQFLWIDKISSECTTTSFFVELDAAATAKAVADSTLNALITSDDAKLNVLVTIAKAAILTAASTMKSAAADMKAAFPVSPSRTTLTLEPCYGESNEVAKTKAAFDEVKKTRADAAAQKRTADRMAMMDVAVGLVAVAANAVALAADGFAPGLGPALNGALDAAGGWAATIADNGIAQALGGSDVIANTIKPADLAGALKSASAGTGAVTAAAQAGYAAASEAAYECGQEMARCISNQNLQPRQPCSTNVTKYLKDYAVEAMKQVAVREVMVGALFLAANYLPVVGPFIKLGKAIFMVGRTISNWMRNHRKYLKEKDADTRRMFWMRDCNWRMFMGLDAEWDNTIDLITKGSEQAGSGISIGTARKTMSALAESVLTAWEINAHLESSLRKRIISPIRGWESPDAHETSVMLRLFNGLWDSWWYPRSALTAMGVSRNAPAALESAGDHYMSQYAFKPSAFRTTGQAIKTKVDGALTTSGR